MNIHLVTIEFIKARVKKEHINITTDNLKNL